MNLSKDLSEFIGLLRSTGVKYLIVGGHAVAFHGHPRFTGDIDFFVERSEANASRLEKVLQDFGFGDLGLTAADFLEPSIVVQLGRPPRRIDLLTSIDGVEFESAWSHRVDTEMGGYPVHFIGKQDLLRNKRATGRAQDLADLQRLEDGIDGSAPR
jgi:hypothetical protein